MKCALFSSIVVAAVAVPAGYVDAQRQGTVDCTVGINLQDSNQGARNYATDTGNISNPSLASESASLSRFIGVSDGDGTATASAAPGYLSVLATAHGSTGGPTINSTTGNYDNFGAASSTATASYTDLLSVENAGVPGSHYYMYSFWKLNGHASSFAGAGKPTIGPNVGLNRATSGYGQAALYLSGTGLDAEELGSSGLVAFDSMSVGYDQYDDPGTSSSQHIDAPKIIDVMLVGTIGVPTQVSVQLFADAGASGDSSDYLSMETATGSSTAEFSHTLTWGGITSITDSDGVPLVGWTVTSDSGLDYSQPVTVPEPTTLLLFGMCGTMLSTVKRPRSSRR